MRIVCEQCQTKYVVPDAKIVKNVLRLTCQKCGNVITTRVDALPNASGTSAASTTDAPAAPTTPSTLDKWRSSSAAPAARHPQSETPSWYYSYNGESFGPFTEKELTEKLLSEKIAPVVEHCYVWRKSFTEWKPVMQVEPFASAILAPPPPAPAPQKAPDASLPPLFSDSSTVNPSKGLTPLSAKTSAENKSSADLPGLKQRLQTTNSATKPKFELPKPKAQSTPADSATPQTTDASNETTRVGSVSPLVSFQSLDAITADIKAESKTGAPNLVKPFPTLSGIAPISQTKSPSTTASAVSRTGVSSIPAAKSTLKSSPANAKVNLSKPLPLPNSSLFNKLNSSSLTPCIESPNPASSASDNQNCIADIVAQSETSKPNTNAQSQLAQNNDFAPASNASVEVSLELESINIDGENSQSGIAVIEDVKSVDIPDIDIDDDSSQIFNKDLLNLDKAMASTGDIGTIDPEQDSPASKNDETPSIDLDSDDDDEPKMMSSAQMLNMVRHSTAGHKAVERITDLPSADLDSIDLDDDDSQFIAPEVINEIVGDGPKQSDILGSTDDLFGDQREENEENVARVRVSHNKLEEISSKYADIFDMPDPEPQHNDEGVSENSMMIQLAHFNKVQQKDQRKRNTALIAGLVGIPLLIALIGFIAGNLVMNQTTEDDVTDAQPTFAKVEGQTVSSGDLEALAPLEDFAIVAANVPKAKTTAKPKTTKQAETKNSDTSAPTADSQAPVPVESETTESAEAAPSNANSEVLDALYGANAQQEPEKPAETAVAMPATKKDGRANIALKSAGDFGSTDAVKGSKYGQLNAGGSASNSREAFTIGLRNVQKSIQECQKREAKNGIMSLPKIYIRLTVNPTGVVDSFEIEENVPENFNKCLSTKKDRWKFAPFEGSAITLRQGFILD